MEYTKNYHLPQWKKEDRIMMDDFNAMCGNIEEGLGTAQSTANTALSTAETARTAASGAQSTANTALAKANNAYSPDQMPYVVGSYVGTGIHQDIFIGFKAKFIIISGQTIETESPEVLLATGTMNTGLLVVHADYISVYPAKGYYPQIDLKGRTYHYIAFR